MDNSSSLLYATPIRSILDETLFPIDFLTGEDGLLAPLLDQLYFRSFAPIVSKDELGSVIDLVIVGEASVSIPGLSDMALVIGGNSAGFTTVLTSVIVSRDGIRASLSTVTLALRFPHNVLKPVSPVEGETAPKYAQIETQGNLLLNESFDINIQGFDSLRLPPSMIGNSGVIIEADNVRIDLSRSSSIPEIEDAGFDDSFLGVFIGEAQVTLPEGFPDLAPEKLILRNAAIGSGGVSGRLEAHYMFNFDSESRTYAGDGAGKLFGIPFGVSDVLIDFNQNAFRESSISGELLLPYFDKRVAVDINLNLDGGFATRITGTVESGDTIDPNSGLFTLHKDGVLKLGVESIGFEVKDGQFTTKLSGQITPLFADLEWPSFQVNELTIDSDGNVHLDGGWLDLREQNSLDFYGFQIEITKLGFGKTEDGGKWIGFSGGLKLADGIPTGNSVEGLRITWYDDERDTKISFDGVGVEFEVEDVLRFKGAVSYRQLEVAGERVDRFDGSIKLDLISLDMEIDATLVFGTAEGDDGRYNFFAIYLALELPAGIPLFATGLSLYGMAGLFAMQMEPDKQMDEEWYGVGPADGWFKRPDTGVTDLTQKWVNREGSLSLGAGVTLGTTADNGFDFSGRMIYMLVFPGPILLIEGKANILKERSKLGKEPTFRTLSVLDKRAGTYLMGLDAQYKSGSKGELIDIGGSAEAFFDLKNADLWHLYLGQDEPREKRIRAEIFSLFEANAYFMMDAHQLATGAWVGYDADWNFGPLAVSLEAWIESNAVISSKPAHLFGELWLHGTAELGVYGFGVGLTIDSRINADVFDPFHVLADFEVGINLPWPLSDIDVDITLEWPSEGPDETPPALPLPLKEIAIEHFKVTTSWPLHRESLLLPNYADAEGFLQDPDPDPTSIENAPPPSHTPIVPVDCRPHITFGRTVHDDALVGINSQPVHPNADPIGWEWIGDPEQNQGPVRARYGLQEISLHKRVEETWKLVARKGVTENPSDIPELFGSWATVPQLPAGEITPDTTEPLANIKLWLWSKTPFDYTRHNGSAWDDWFIDHFPDYPCIPMTPDQEICCDFEKIDLDEVITSPWHCPKHKELQLLWNDFEQPQTITVLEQPIDGLTHALCPSLPFLHIQLHAIVRKVSITVVADKGVQATSYNLAGTELNTSFGGLPEDPHVVVEAEGISFVLLKSTSKMCLLKICVASLNSEEATRREKMTQHLSDEMARWQQEGEVLEPHTTYRLKVMSTLETKEFTYDVDFNKVREQSEYAYFQTEGPPGLTTLSVPEGHTNPEEFDCGLDDLTRYVRQTIPATVPAEGEKPPLPRPVYRAYDVGVEFNEDYVDLMYRLERRDLGLYLYDNNNRPVRDAQGRLMVLNNRWAVTEELTLTESERLWVKVVDASTCTIIDSSLIPHDDTIISAIEGQVLDSDTVYEARLVPMLLHEDFGDLDVGTIVNGPAGSLGRWQVHDQGSNSGPSHWVIGEEGAPASKFIGQTSNIYGGTLNGNDPLKPGTLLLLADNFSLPTDHIEQPVNWSDYQFSVILRSGDNDAIGIVFRYLDEDNYYFFAMDRERKYRRFVRVVEGIHTILANDDFVYREDQGYLLTVEVIDSSLRVYQNGVLVFDVTDDSIDHGRIGLYCWGNAGAHFSDVRVDDFSTVAPVVYRFKFTTSQFANLFHHLHSFQDEAWRATLEADQLSDVDLSALLAMAVLPESEISDSETRTYNSLIEHILGSSSSQNPLDVQIKQVVRNEEPIAMLLQSPEPIDWKRTSLEVLSANRSFLPPELPGVVKLTDVSYGMTQANEEFVTLLLRKNFDLSGHRIEYCHLPCPVVEPAGDLVLFNDDFDIEVGGFLFHETFGPNALDFYEIIDEGMNLGPSNWSVIDGTIIQTSNIYGGSISGSVLDKPGTMAITGSSSWSNVVIRTTFISEDDDAIGIIFRFQDSDNYYRLSMDRERSYRRLVKKVDGSFSVLWQDDVAYNQGQSYGLVIYAHRHHLLCYLDDIFLFNVEDTDIATGRAGFYCWANTGAHYKELSIETLEAQPILWQPTFEDLGEVEIVDQGAQQGPSQWQANDGILLQSSNIYGGSIDSNIPDKPGTFVLGGNADWQDIRISTRLSSGDNDAIGLMFRVTPLVGSSGEELGYNYYRFSMDSERGYRRLVKKIGDITTVLWQDSFSFNVNQNYELSVDAVGSELRAYLDGTLLFIVHDGDLRAGKIGLYCWANTGAKFEQVVVMDRIRRIKHWRIYDEGTINAPSIWRLHAGSLTQTSNIFGGSTFGSDPIKPGTFVVAGNLSWSDYRLTVTLFSDDDDAIGVIFRYVDQDNYYLLSLDAQRDFRRLVKKEDGIVTVLWDEAGGYTVGISFALTIDVIGSRLVGYMDNDRLFDIVEATHATGQIGLYSWGNIGARFEQVEVRMLPLEARTLLSDRFADDDLSGWSFLDEGTAATPSVWSALEGALRQTSNIYEPPNDRNTLSKKGTQAISGDPAWTNVIFTARLQSFDNDALGLLFRYTDENNYYRFSMDAERSYRRLVKNVNGIFTLLWEDNDSYEVGQSYEITIISIDNMLRGYADSVPIFVIEDGDLTSGRVGLYCWANTDARFSQVRLYPADLIFNDWLLDEQFNILIPDRWTFVDEGDQQSPSQWEITDSELRQTSDIHGGNTDGSVPDKPGTYALTGDLAWKDYRLSVRLSSDDDNAIGVMFRYLDSDNYYRFSMDRELGYRRLIKQIDGVITVLWQDDVQYIQSREYNLTIECVGKRLTGYLDGVQLFTVEDGDLIVGRIGLYCWANSGARFMEVRVVAQICTTYYTFEHEKSLPAGTRVRVYSGNQSGAPLDVPGLEQRFLASFNDPGKFHLSTEGVQLQLRARGEDDGHTRLFLPDEDYTSVDARVIRKADGTGLFIVKPTGERLSASSYRFNMSYRRDNRTVESDSQAFSQAGNSESEIVKIDIPWEY